MKYTILTYNLGLMMCAAQKKSLLLLLFSLVYCWTYGQELTAGLANDIKYSRFDKLEEFATGQAINSCLGVGNSKKYNFLAMSIKLKSLESLKYFVENGANVDGVCADKTPLMYAAKYGQLKHFEYLVEQGADLDKKIRGKSALYFARRYNQRAIVNYIKALKSP